MTNSHDRLSINRRTLLAAGSGMTLTAAVPAAALAFDTPKDDLYHQIATLIEELESDHGSGLAAVNWSRRHIANKLRAALNLPVEKLVYDADYTEFYKKTL
ncbi:hypothetical protein [Ruegeria sp. HU-ET01832]|uniref:hypothetical protein n=1 Tax=Ruegeria sp. HU-ET01832 TaxID=3135906 RepID=UPI00333E7912